MDDTIAAIATPLAEGGLGIVRISGKDAFLVADGVAPLKNGQSWATVDDHTLHLTYVRRDDGQAVDQVLLSVFHAPGSFTGEDTIELNCHGGPLVLELVLELVLANGARLAEAGEFTQRAFLNGKLDLTQAEAIIDLIKARTRQGAQLAVEQLKGSLSAVVGEIRGRLLRVLAYQEASLDFPEDEIDDLAVGEIENELTAAMEQINRLIQSSDQGIIMRQGIKTAIVGRPNVGKSSLMNFLLGRERSIVTNIPGTTRDVIEETVNFKGLPLVLLDTAGVRPTDDLVERLGVERSWQGITEAQLVLVVLDVCDGITKEDLDLLQACVNKKVVVVLNKIDLKPEAGPALRKDLLDQFPEAVAVEISALQGTGLEELAAAIKEMVFHGAGGEVGETALVTRTRHREHLRGAQSHLEDALKAVKDCLPADFIAIDVASALKNLDEITGDNVSEELLNFIFQEFCIGK